MPFQILAKTAPGFWKVGGVGAVELSVLVDVGRYRKAPEISVRSSSARCSLPDLEEMGRCIYLLTAAAFTTFRDVR